MLTGSGLSRCCSRRLLLEVILICGEYNCLKQKNVRVEYEKSISVYISLKVRRQALFPVKAQVTGSYKWRDRTNKMSTNAEEHGMEAH